MRQKDRQTTAKKPTDKLTKKKKKEGVLPKKKIAYSLRRKMRDPKLNLENFCHLSSTHSGPQHFS